MLAIKSYCNSSQLATELESKESIGALSPFASCFFLALGYPHGLCLC